MDFTLKIKQRILFRHPSLLLFQPEEIAHSSILRKLRIDSFKMTLPFSCYQQFKSLEYAMANPEKARTGFCFLEREMAMRNWRKTEAEEQKKVTKLKKGCPSETPFLKSI